MKWPWGPPVRNIALGLPEDIAAEVRRVGPRGEDGVLGSGAADGGVGPVAGTDDSIIGQDVELAHNGVDLLPQILGRVAMPWATGEQGVAGYQVAPVREAEAARGVARGVEYPPEQPADGYLR